MKKISRKTALIILAVVLTVAGAIGSFAAGSGMDFESDSYEASFFMNHLQVHLLENGRDVCGGENTLDGESKVTGELVGYLGYENEDKLGSFEPGKMYKEEIAAGNGQDIPVYVRMTIRKYWLDPETKEKITTLSPDLIRLSYDGKEYNSSAWVINEHESTAEASTYYCRSVVPAGKSSATLFNRLVIDSKIADDYEVTTDENKETGVTTYTYVYRYDGSAFMIKADVQAVQTHNANDAMESQWGVSNVAVRGGKITVD